ncbi:MAG: prepilin-type N-terminal cleavage/methylation domain-containing protein [Pirellulales bacterium]|nr:prepilin-type N-terminal cleavage/methylation domain-containing protein [Pirellulales bacterium]
MNGQLRYITHGGCHWLLASRCKRPGSDSREHWLTSSQCHPRSGFTLIELLITITIIGLLSAVVLGALQSARETAKYAKTKATITKLHYIIMARYDSYRTRRVPIDTKGMNPQAAAHARLMGLRDLMRMEMPDRSSDLSVLVPPIISDPPSILSRYRRLGDKDKNGTIDLGLHPSAELLYMIVMAIPEAAEQFSGTEIADTDGNGLPEFIDGWGHPIKFIRWPVGFLRDGSVVKITPPVTITYGAETDLQDVNTPDPFDPMKITGGFAVFPLIYSAGPDGVYDINNGYGLIYVNAGGNLNPYVVDTNVYFAGQPVHLNQDGSPNGTPAPENLYHYDNIHNHMLEVR